MTQPPLSEAQPSNAQHSKLTPSPKKQKTWRDRNRRRLSQLPRDSFIFFIGGAFSLFFLIPFSILLPVFMAWQEDTTPKEVHPPLWTWTLLVFITAYRFGDLFYSEFHSHDLDASPHIQKLTPLQRRRNANLETK